MSEVPTITNRIAETIQGILTKLGEVRRRGLTCFGSDRHRFLLNPPLTEVALQRFERKHGVQLPAGYRAFLRLAGNGGAGPYYGLLPLEKWSDAVLENLPRYLARPSPLQPRMSEGFEWEQALNCPWEELFQGTLALVHQGCAYYALLVVTGAYRGRVVYVNLDRCGTPYFVRDPDFLAWYERWLDELLWGYDDSWFGIGLPGREEDMVEVLRRPTADADLRSEALSTLSRVPALRQETLNVVQAVLGDRSPTVRAQAVHLLGKHGVRGASAAIDALTRDPAPAVRKAALAGLAKIPGHSWEAAARLALRDESESVVFEALCLLKDAQLLHRGDIETMLQSADPKVRSNALWAANSVVGGPGQVAITDDLLFDPSKEVRRYAILGAGRNTVTSLLRLLRLETDVELVSCIVSVLGNLGDAAGVPALLDMTRHTDGFVRQGAARALGKLGDRRAIRALEALLADDTKPERRDEHGFPKVYSTRSVADEARSALAQIATRQGAKDR